MGKRSKLILLFIRVHKALTIFAQLSINRVSQKCPQLFGNHQATCSRQFLNRQLLLCQFCAIGNILPEIFEHLHWNISLLCAAATITRSRIIISKLPLHKHHALRPPKSTASSRPTAQLRTDPLYRIHDVERSLRYRRLALTDRRCPLRLHGTRVPKRRSAIFMEQEFL